MPASTRVKSLIAELERRELAVSRQWVVKHFGRAALDASVARGEVIRILDNYYTHRARSRDTLTRASATSAWLAKRGVVGGPTAAFLLGLTHDPKTVHVLALPRIHIRGPSWMKIRHRQPPRRTTVAHGVVIACVEDAAIQTWEHLGERGGSHVPIESVRRGLTSAPSIAERSAEYPTIKSRRHLMVLLGDLAGGIDSFLELQAARTVFVGGELGAVRRHVTIRTSTSEYIVDFFHEQARLAIETDGRQFHSSDHARRRDLARDADLATIDIQTLRLTYEDIMNRPDWCRQTVTRAINARLARYGRIR